MVWLPRNKKQTYQLNARPQMGSSGLTLAMTFSLNFQGQLWNLLYLSQKWSDCHEAESKHIDQNLGFKWDHRVWFWPWPWSLILKVKYIDWTQMWPWPWKVRCEDLTNSDRGDFRCRHAVNLSSFSLWPSSSKNTSVRPSVHPSVCMSVTPFSLCSHYRIIDIFRSDYPWQKWCPSKRSRSGQRSRSQRLKPNLAISGL